MDLVSPASGSRADCLVDSHVHLDRYPDDVVAAMLARARAAGVTRLLTIGTDAASSRAALALAGRFPATGPLPAVDAAVGIHPTRLRRAAETGAPEETLRTLLERTAGTAHQGGQPPGQHPDPPAPWPAAIGEVGLDDQAPDPAAQRRFLESCVRLAAAHDLPLVLHVVGRAKTHEVALNIVRQTPQVRVVAHYFVGGPELARRYLDAGCWLAVGKPVTRRGELVRQAIPAIPLDRLLLETDTYPLPGRATEPRDVAEVCAAVAALRDRPYADVARATTASFTAFLGR